MTRADADEHRRQGKNISAFRLTTLAALLKVLVFRNQKHAHVDASHHDYQTHHGRPRRDPFTDPGSARRMRQWPHDSPAAGPRTRWTLDLAVHRRGTYGHDAGTFPS